MKSLTYWQLLSKNKSFRRLCAGQVVSELGNWFNFIAGLGLVRAVSAAAPEATSILLVARLAPFAVVSPIAGALVDRWSRRTVMIFADVARAIIACGFLFVTGPETLWIAYSCTAALTLLAAFFEGAKNASLPSITGEDGLLAGTALMFSSRFLLMSAGAALGGIALATIGYRTAFVVNAASFLVSAFSVWLIPARELKKRELHSSESDGGPPKLNTRVAWYSEFLDGWKYIIQNPLVASILGINFLWAIGGGAIFLIFDRMGAIVLAARNGFSPDSAVSILYSAGGLGLFLGMLMARRVGSHVEINNLTGKFIGWMVLLHGLAFALCGMTGNLWLAATIILVSRAIIGVEFAIQETLLMRVVPEQFRGRVSTTDRASEILVMSLSTAISGWSLKYITVGTLAIFSGLSSGFPGLIWLFLYSKGTLQLPHFSEESRELALGKS